MQTDEPPFIKNKFAQLVVGVLCADFPHAWPHVFAQLLSLLPNGPVVIDVFLRVLNTVHEEVVSAEGSGHDPQLAARVKDGMREGCLPQVVDAWRSILQLHETVRPGRPRDRRRGPSQRRDLHRPDHRQPSSIRHRAGGGDGGGARPSRG